MKTFHCAICGMMVFFENTRCVKCDHPLGFLPDALELCALTSAGENKWQAAGAAANKSHRSCANGRQHNVCNWLVPENDSNAWCAACRLNEVIPNLTDAKNLARWKKLELAKRRCIYTLLRLGLRLEYAHGDKATSLSFKFLEDSPASPVKTGHENGLITVNVAEADDDERECRRVNLREPYRTLVGHFRHETGHFYWDALIAGSNNLQRFREMFGDETAPYSTALERYYQQGPAADWTSNFVTAYASSHPWEDWAETWAHYLHIVDTLESAAAFRLSIRDHIDKPGARRIEYMREMDFDDLIAEWTPLICSLNAINRSMGLYDLYPFVIPPKAVDKLRFVHEMVLNKKK